MGLTSEKGGRVVYEIKVQKRPSNSETETAVLKKFNNQLDYYAGFLEKLETELIFSDVSSFYRTNYMDLGSQSIPEYIKIIFNVNEEYYADLLEKNNFRLEEIDDKKFLVKTEMEKLNWKITTEIKFIQGIKVKKAIYVSNSKKHPKTICVWFAPSIPYNFGPAEFSFFPGLVLEVDVISKFPITITAKEITIDRKFKFKSLPKAEILTENKLDELYLKIRGNQKELLKNN